MYISSKISETLHEGVLINDGKSVAMKFVPQWSVLLSMLIESAMPGS